MKKNTLNLMKFVKQVYNATAIMIYTLYENHFYKNRVFIREHDEKQFMARCSADGLFR